MSKEAKTIYEIHPFLKQRWSPRAFEDKAIEVDKIQRILEAARWSPSASNEQPWFFIVGQKDDPTYQKIFDSLVEFNQLWAKFAPVLILSIGKMISNKTGEKHPIFKYDVGQSIAYLTFQAIQEGLYVHQMTGFDTKKAGELFEIPENYTAISVMAIGYIGDVAMLHPRMQKIELAERERKDLKEFIFIEKFGKQADFI